MKIKLLVTLVLVTAFLMSTPLTMQANSWQWQGGTGQHHTYGLNRNEGHFGAITANDFHTPMWQRFMPPNYNFSSGPNYRYTLGQPTYAHHFTRDTTFANVRRDAQSSFNPPSVGVFSGVVPTERNNTLIPIVPQTQPIFVPSAHAMTPWDSTGQGANAHFQHGTSMTIDQNQGGMLPSTSILGQ